MMMSRRMDQAWRGRRGSIRVCIIIGVTSGRVLLVYAMPAMPAIRHAENQRQCQNSNDAWSVVSRSRAAVTPSRPRPPAQGPGQGPLCLPVLLQRLGCLALKPARSCVVSRRSSSLT
ncbi:hypothetical protein EDB80DRAFT_323580 [Ilyonectria destructans]|nr:hypothetical protein EDB80DRAFT_323580 [Ilyonectria destructans]